LARSLRAQQRAIERLTRQAGKLIAQEPELRERFELLDSIPGVGETSAVQLLGELAVLAPDLDARQWVAYAGMDPRECTSGSSVHKKQRISEAGNKHLRHTLFMPALAAVRHDPYLGAFYQHLLAKGNFKMQALVAVMRKLLHAIHAMFKNHQPYDGSKLFQLRPIPAQRCPVLQSLAELKKEKRLKKERAFPCTPFRKKKLLNSKRESTRSSTFQRYESPSAGRRTRPAQA
jgi:hypothetical protein